MTAIFIVIDRRFVRNPDGWDPRTVNSMGPDVDVSTIDGIAEQLIGKAHLRVVPVTASILEIGLVALTLTVALAIGLPARVGFLKPGPGWVDVFVPVIGAIVLSFLGPVVNLFRPTWTRVRIAAHVLVNGATIAIGAVSLAIGNWVVLAEPASATAEMARLVEGINGFVRVSIAITIVLTAVTGALGLRRRLRMSRASEESA